MKSNSTNKSGLHERNKHRGRYDFNTLIQASPKLNEFVKTNRFGDETIDFFNPMAVKALNQALLKFHYNIDWDIPKGFLCPPIPGRADYIHRIADLLSEGREDEKNPNINCLDIGVGANCIYPIIGVTEYDWSFIASDISEESLNSAKSIVENNEILKNQIELRFQKNPKLIYQGILNEGEFVDAVICNPPFHGSAQEAERASLRKLKNLKGKKNPKLVLNFEGKNEEVWCKGGEKQFIHNMIRQSQDFRKNCLWFTVLVSKQTILKGIYKFLEEVRAVDVKTIEMSQGNKTSRVVAWTFLSPEGQKAWKKRRW